MRVDEPRRDDEPGGVEDRLHAGVRHRAEVAHGDDAVARDADVGPTARRPGAVDQGAAADHEVERHAPIVPVLGSPEIGAPVRLLFEAVAQCRRPWGDQLQMTIEALRGHRPEVLDDLLARYGRELQGVAYLVLRDRAAAEDVVVDTLLTALDHGDELRDPDALRAWLLRIATNRALGMRRSSSRVVQLHVVPDRPARWADEDERLTLLSCVDRLAPRMRAAVVLRYYADLSVRQVADAMGTSENTVKTQLREALEHMRAALADGSSRREREAGEASHG